MSGAEEADPGLRGVVSISVFAGIFPLSPIPFVDDWIIAGLRRRMLRGLFADTHPLSREQLRVLTHRPSGWLRGCLLAPIFYVIKRISRKIIIFLALKACVDTTSTLLHEGLLVRHALRSGLLTAEDLHGGQTRALEILQQAVERTLEQTDPSPVTQLLRRVLRGGRLLLRRGRATAIDELIDAIWSDAGYLPVLYGRLDQQWSEVSEAMSAEE